MLRGLLLEQAPLLNFVYATEGVKVKVPFCFGPSLFSALNNLHVTVAHLGVAFPWPLFLIFLVVNCSIFHVATSSEVSWMVLDPGLVVTKCVTLAKLLTSLCFTVLIYNMGTNNYNSSKHYGED